jgi:hypothetical protein
MDEGRPVDRDQLNRLDEIVPDVGMLRRCQRQRLAECDIGSHTSTLKKSAIYCKIMRMIF